MDSLCCLCVFHCYSEVSRRPSSWTPRNTLEDPYRSQVIDESQSIASRTLTLPIIRHRPSVLRSSSPGPQHIGGSCSPACRVSVACRSPGRSWTLTHFGPHLRAINSPVPFPVSLLGRGTIYCRGLSKLFLLAGPTYIKPSFDSWVCFRPTI